MTDKEIIKWWEQITELCNECHPDSFKNVQSKEVANATFDLLKSLRRISNSYRYLAQAQKGELERLYKQNAEYKAEIEDLKSRQIAWANQVRELNYEIEEMKKKPEIYNADFVKYKQLLFNGHRKKGIKEFAEALTDTILDKSDRSLDNPNGNDYFISDVIEDIDNLVKEMVGENDG